MYSENAEWQFDLSKRQTTARHFEYGLTLTNKGAEAFNWRGWHNMLTIEPSDPQRFAGVAKLVKKFAPEIRISATVTSRVALDLINCIDIATVHLEADYDKDAIDKLRKSGVELRWYNCCTPDWGNTLFNCDLIDAYRISWITEQGKYKGFLRWSIIGWPESWHQNPGFNWPTGDTYLIAPGKSGPVETLRWHAYRQGYQDLHLLLQLKLTPEVQYLLSEIGANQALDITESPGDFQQRLYHLIYKRQQNSMAFAAEQPGLPEMCNS